MLMRVFLFFSFFARLPLYFHFPFYLNINYEVIELLMIEWAQR